jgi:hypothetical protein
MITLKFRILSKVDAVDSLRWKKILIQNKEKQIIIPDYYIVEHC